MGNNYLKFNVLHVVVTAQPWRCLWRPSLQMTRTTPLRRTILQLRQIRLTEARTFISFHLL